MLEDHLGTIPSLQAHLRYVLGLSNPVGDEGMPQRVVLPGNLGPLRQTANCIRRSRDTADGSRSLTMEGQPATQVF